MGGEGGAVSGFPTIGELVHGSKSMEWRRAKKRTHEETEQL